MVRKENWQDWRGDRRDFLKGAFNIGKKLAVGGVVVSAAAPLLTGCDLVNRLTQTPQSPENIVPEESLAEVVSKIKAFEAEIGSRGLSFEEANGYIPLITKLFVKSTGSAKTAEELARNTYILRGEPHIVEDTIKLHVGPVEDPFSFSVVKRFQQDYPNVSMTEDLAQVIAGNSDQVGGMFWNNMTFLVIGDTNSVEIDDYFRQFEGAGLKVKCGSKIPVVETRSRLLHEYMHAEGMPTFRPVEQEFFDAYFKLGNDPLITEKQVMVKGVWTRVLVAHSESDPSQEIVYFSNGLKSNFIFHFTGYWPTEDFTYEQDYMGLNEHITDYLSSRINVQNDLPYTLGDAYGSPYAYANLEAVLAQSGVTYKELLRLYRNSDLMGLYLRIADGAQNIKFSAIPEKLQFGFARINPLLSVPSYLGEDANGKNLFAPYFPGVSRERNIVT